MFGRAIAVCCLVVLFLFCSSAFAEFDGRLPISPGEPLDPNGPLPPHAEDFMREHGGDFMVYWDFLLDTPRYLSPRTQVRLVSDLEPLETFEARLVAAAEQFIDDHAAFFGVESASLESPHRVKRGKAWILYFRQSAWGIPIGGANLRMVVAGDGRLVSVKAFLLRDDPELFVPTSRGTASVDRVQEQLGHFVEDVEPQYFFPRYDPASITPIWRVLFMSANNEPGEVFANQQTGELIEERRFISHQEKIYGTISGHFPTTDQNDPNFFFTTPIDISPTPQPVINALVSTLVDIGLADEGGNFELLSHGVSTDVDWSLRYFECTEPQIFDPDGEAIQFCPLPPIDVGQPLNFENTTIDVFITMWSGSLGCSSRRFLVGNDDDEIHQVDTAVDFVLNPLQEVFGSSELMAYHHLMRYAQQARSTLRDVGLAEVDLTGLNATIIESKNVSHFLPSRTSSTICMSYKLSGTLGQDQWLTPTLMNHEYAHHVLYRITNFKRSVKFDCFDDASLDCVERQEDPSFRREASFVEGITHALAAYYADTPRFGYYSRGEIAGPLAYDIAVADGSLEDRVRFGGANLFWEIRERFIGDSDPSSGQFKIKIFALKNLLYNWLGSNISQDDTARAFDYGPSLLDEILDTENLFNEGEHVNEIIAAFEGFEEIVRAPFIRGDANQDGQVGLSDAIHILNHLFLGQVDPRCLDALDSDDQNNVDTTDAVYLLMYLFLGGGSPPAPYPGCGLDMTPDPRVCDEFGVCERL